MKAIVLKVQANPSKKTGGTVYQLCFKDVDSGKSYTTWVDSGFRNYENWRRFMSTQIVLDGLRIKKDNLVDADSRPWLIEKDELSQEQLSIAQIIEEE